MKNVFIIIGPTASGKTSKALALAKEKNGVIINADAFQVYKEMDIGTAKIKESEMKGIKHLLFSYIDPSEEYDVVRWRRDCYEAISETLSKGKLPIICGGSNLYINALLFNYNFQINVKRISYPNLTNKELWKKLKILDPVQAEMFHFNNRKRTERALNIALSGKLKTDVDKNNGTPLYRYTLIHVDKISNREKHYNKINKRVDKMIEDGLENEVKELYNKYDFKLRSFQAIGYKEWIPFFENKISRDEVIENIKRNSRKYAKKQLTWIKKHY